MTREGEVVFVTGASRGLGQAIASAFTAKGATIVGAGRDRRALEASREICGTLFHGVVLDVSDESACERAVANCESEFGKIDTLIHAAGISETGPFLKLETDIWRRVMSTDVEGPMWLTRAALPNMLERGSGSVIAIGSISAKVGFKYVAAYTAAKHALLGLIRALAAEFPKSGITFNCVCPWFVDTDMLEASIQKIMNGSAISREEAVALLSTPQGRLVSKEEVAAMCLFLASEEARGLTGQSINVDGGLRQD